MIEPAERAARRRTLTGRVDGPILLMGNGLRDRNLPGYGLPFRQDSTFLYYVGVNRPGAAALLHDGETTLFLPPSGSDDALWHGPSPSLGELGAAVGIRRTRPAAELPGAIRAVGGPVHTLAVADAARTALAAELLGIPLSFGASPGSTALIDAVIDQRRRKSPTELAELRRAAHASGDAHRAAMACTHPGGSEAALTALFHAVLEMHGCTPGYDTILSQDGEILHNHTHGNDLEAGRLLLCDGGGEVASGYGADITRTWAVDGRFTPRQRAAYEAVLEAQAASIDAVRAGVRYRHVHDASSLVLARFLVDEGLLRGDPDGLVEQHAHALFFPHGVGHHLGLDVHDMENFGDRPSYPPGRERPAAFGTRYLRLDLPLEPGWVVTIEPGFYIVPAILDDASITGPFESILDRERVDAWRGFGGIRIEDDVVVTDDEPEILSTATPKSVAAVEALVGTGRDPRDLLTGF